MPEFRKRLDNGRLFTTSERAIKPAEAIVIVMHVRRPCLRPGGQLEQGKILAVF
ncbi:hypothetical protein HRbin36_01551 [bacterium HR36]|nr:hypothetical protein HRbin36_01551 [bacterium HR36]